MALERGTLGTWVESKCHATLMHEHGSGNVRGMENTWPSNGLVSNRFGGGVLHLTNSLVVEEEEKNLFSGIEKRGKKEMEKRRNKERIKK